MGRVTRCRVRIGCAGWAIPKVAAARFAGEGTHLQRYASQLDAVEINSSFHRPHAATTYAKWAAAVPTGFRFAVKAPREITHEHALVDVDSLLAVFLAQIAGLGRKLGPVLVQLPPSHDFDMTVAKPFFRALRARFEGDVVLEPRHPTWCSPAADRLLIDHRVARVAADPPVGGCREPSGWPELRYVRLHGSPDVYWSSYDAARLASIEATVRQLAGAARVWCVFDNTAAGAASLNALDLRESIPVPPRAASRPGATLAAVDARRRT